MSLFSYISFPREVDKRCLINTIDDSKSISIDKISDIEFIKSAPEDMIYPYDTRIYLKDSTAIQTLSSGISINSTNIIIPDNIFKNKFVYDFFASLKLFKQNPYVKSYVNMSKEERNTWYLLEKDMKDRTVYHKKQLYDILKLNLKLNEFSEIYSITVTVNQNDGQDIYDFGLPTEVRKIDLENVLTSKLLDCDSNLKIIIYRTK